MTAQVQSGRPAVVQCVFCGTPNRIDLGRLADLPKCGQCGRPIRLDRPLPVSDASFDKVIQGSSVPVLVDFYADWCGPCKMMAPTVDELARKHMGVVLVLKMDTEANRATPARFGIRGIPTSIVFEQGQETRRHVGLAQMAELEALAGVGA